MYVTYVHHYGQCPSWKKDVCISGKYILNESANKGKFLKAECPILEDLRLPYHKRKLVYREIPYCHNSDKCDLLKDFPGTMDF